MAAKAVEIPFSYGELVSITPAQGTVLHFWFRDYGGVIRGVPVDVENPSTPKVIEKEQIVLKRRTEGTTRRRRSMLAPLGAASKGKK